MKGLAFDPGLDIGMDGQAMSFCYGPGVFGPAVEYRLLEDVRATLLDPAAHGPQRLYAIAMDMGRQCDRGQLIGRSLLFGACIYAAGRIGKEPVRSQGHVHAVSASSGTSTPELYQILQGRAIVFMQPGAGAQTDIAYAVRCGPGDMVIVPPGFAHYTVNADPDGPMAFGAWCVRDYGFDYEKVRAMRGLSYYPLLGEDGQVLFHKNPSYGQVRLVQKVPADYAAFGLRRAAPIYPLLHDPQVPLDFVARPADFPQLWEGFVP